MEKEISINPPSSFDFPFPPYPIQDEFMRQLFLALENKKLGIFESPTGTGKSLSIICGALKWLYDRNSANEEVLKSEIANLEKQKTSLQADSKDWLNSQAQEIVITKKLNLLKLKEKSVEEYNKKIEELKSKKKITKTKKQWKKELPKNEKGTNLDDDTYEKDVEDDILLEEFENVIKDESDEENENDEIVHEPVKILICSRTHSQLSQLVGEIIKSPFGGKTRVITLASRQIYCLNPSINKIKNGSVINERCLDMQKKKSNCLKQEDKDGKVIKRKKTEACSCPYYKSTAIDELKDQALIDICDVEDLIGLGEELKACPYYASRKAVQDAEVILLPYNTLLHKATREANAINLKNNVVIIDEAHNLLEALAQMYSSEITLEQIELCLIQLKNYKQRFSARFSAQNLLSINQLTYVVNKLNSFLSKNIDSKSEEIESRIFTIPEFVVAVDIDNFNFFKLLKFVKDSRIGQKLHSYTVKNPKIFEKNEKDVNKLKGVQQFLSTIEKSGKGVPVNVEQKSDTKQKLNFANPFLIFSQFLESLTCSYEDGRIIMYQNKHKNQCKFSFLLLNPAGQFKEIISEARSVIVAGGTMQPLSEFRDRLFISAGASSDRIVNFSCDHVIPKENILPIIITNGRNNENLLFNFENRLKMGKVLKDIFQESCKKVPGGIVVFFPSYKYEAWVWEQVKDVPFGRPVFREPQDSSGVESVLESYASAIKKSTKRGAILFSVVGGKLSEGLNFSDDLGRCVIVVGLPYSNKNSPDLKEKMSYLERKHGCGSGKNFYEAMCTKAVNQCIGRAVRHQNDYATIILLDVRFDRPSTKNSLPGWIKRSLRTCDFLEAFGVIEKGKE